MRFADRRDAGRQLAKRLEAYRTPDTVVLGIPRGGVVAAYEVAGSLGAPLDVIVARKVGAPFNEELALAAVAPDGIMVMNEDLAQHLGIGRKDIAPLAAAAVREMERRLALFRGNRPAPALAGKTVIVVDDGVATGLTVAAALLSLRSQKPARLILAVPVASPEAVDFLKPLVDEMICLYTPATLMAVGEFYRDFEQTTDEEVMRLLQDNLLAAYQFRPEVMEEEEDGSVTIALDELDWVVNAATREKAVAQLVSDVKDYAHRYMEQAQIFINAPNRREHLPWVTRILLCESDDAIREVLGL